MNIKASNQLRLEHMTTTPGVVLVLIIIIIFIPINNYLHWKR